MIKSPKKQYTKSMTNFINFDHFHSSLPNDSIPKKYETNSFRPLPSIDLSGNLQHQLNDPIKLHSNKEFQILRLQLEQQLLLYEETKRCWANDLIQMNKCISILKNQVNENLSLTLEWISETISVLTNINNDISNISNKNDEEINENYNNDNIIRSIQKTKNKILGLIKNLSNCKLQTNRIDGSNLIKKMDPEIKNTILRVENLVRNYEIKQNIIITASDSDSKNNIEIDDENIKQSNIDFRRRNLKVGLPNTCRPAFKGNFQLKKRTVSIEKEQNKISNPKSSPRPLRIKYEKLNYGIKPMSVSLFGLIYNENDFNLKFILGSRTDRVRSDVSVDNNYGIKNFIAYDKDIDDRIEQNKMESFGYLMMNDRNNESIINFLSQQLSPRFGGTSKEYILKTEISNLHDQANIMSGMDIMGSPSSTKHKLSSKKTITCGFSNFLKLKKSH